MSNSYLATALQIHQDLRELQFGLVRALIEGRKVLRILGQSESNGIVHKVGHGPLNLCRLQPQRTVEESVKVDRRSP